MDRFAAIETFVRVAETRSFSEAARRLRIAKSAVSRQVSALEAELGARLFHRTTRSLHLTEAGRAYFERASRILSDLDDADRAVSRLQAAPRGRLRISAPMSFGFLHLTPALADFLRLHPEVEMDVAMNDRVVDLVNEGFDVAVRIGILEDSSLIARRLAPARRAICASPDYLATRGAPRTPDDLKSHSCLVNSNLPAGREWRLTGPEGAVRPIGVNGPLSVNNGDAMRVAALRGLGLASLPTFIVGADLKSGALVSVLDEFIPQDLTISAVYPHTRHLSPTVRAFVDFLAERFGPNLPYWDVAGSAEPQLIG